MDETAGFMGQGFQPIKGMHFQFIFPALATEWYELHVFWLFILMEVMPHL